MSTPSDKHSTNSDPLGAAAGDAPSGTPGAASGASPGAADGAPRDDGDVARVARGAGISTVGQGVGRLVGYGIQLAIGRLYGPAGIALYALGIAAVNGANILARFGMDNGVVRWVAHYQTRGDDSRVRGTIVQSIGVTFVLSLALSALMFFGAGAVAGFYDKPRLEPIVAAFAVALPFYTFMSMALWATQGFKTVTYATYVQQMIRPALQLALIGVFYFVMDGLIGAVIAYAVSMLLGSVVAVYFLWKLFPPLFDRKTPAVYETRELFDVSIPMSVTTLAQYANNYGAIQILGYFAAAGPTGIFTLAARTATFLTIVRFAFGGIFSPIISGFHARGEMDELGRLYKDVSRWIFTGGFAIFLMIVVLGEDVLSVVKPAFAAGWTALIIVGAAQLFSSSVGPTPRMLAMTGNQRVVMVATAAAALAGVLAAIALVSLAPTPESKILAAATGMALGILAENTATLLAVKRRLGFWPYNREWLKPLTAGLISAAIAYATGLLIPMPAIPAILVLGMVFGVGYLALLVLFGLSETDKEFLAAFWNVAKRHLRRGSRSRENNRE